LIVAPAKEREPHVATLPRHARAWPAHPRRRFERGLSWGKIHFESSRCRRTARVTLLVVALIAGMLLAAGRTYAAEHSLSSFSPDAILEKVQKRIFLEIGSPPKEIFIRWKNDVHIGVVADSGIPADTLRIFLDDVSDIHGATNQNFTLFGKTSNFVVFFSQDLDSDLQIHEDLLSQFFLSRTLYRQNFESYKEKKIDLHKQERGRCGWSNRKIFIVRVSVARPLVGRYQ
jgi:hypothetical protein